MFSWLRKFLKKQPLWVRFSHSDIYQKFRNPKFYKKQIQEKIFFQNILKNFDNKLIFDVGANIGSKSVIFSHIAKRVIAFEPTDQCVYILKNRILKSNVEIVQCALSNENSIKSFYEVEDDSAYSSLSNKHIDNRVSKDLNVSSKSIKTYTLDYFIDNYGIPSFIKIDVEGYEKEVIYGLTNPVKLISFESNLPEFLSESIDVINYLDKISSGNYKYNYSSEGDLLINNFVNKETIINRVKKVEYSSIEIYAKLFDD
tara:strand:+ start:174 stop:944 length:771 start_codon:yes stop_codon:yes gene_type:complete